MTAAAGSRTPLLVTGTHRSGTTWVGEMLAVSPAAHYVHEPFAPMYARSWMRRPPVERFHHEPPDRSGAYLADLERIVSLRPPWATIARRDPHPKHLARLLQEAWTTRGARRAGARAVIKDPFALLAAEWIARYSGAQPIVLVRHPAAFASSIERLGWRLDVTWLLRQPTLTEGDLAPFVPALERDHELDIVDHASLVWRALNTVVQRYARDHPTWSVLRYEDLAADPLRGFRSLYALHDLPWTDEVAATIARRNAVERGADVAPGGRGPTDRDSRRAMWTWLTRLSDEDVRRVRDATADVASAWYGDERWWPSDVAASGPPPPQPGAHLP